MSELRSHDCLSDLDLDQLLGASLPPATHERAQAHVAECAGCALRLEALGNQRDAFLERMPTWERLHTQQTRRRSRRWLLGGGAALAASAVLAVMVVPASTPSGVRNKGGPYIGAYVKHGDHVTRANDGARVEPGDHVLFTYSSDEPVYFALLNRDAQRATTYYPLGPETERVAAGSDVKLDFSIKLDAAPGSERVHGLFCERPTLLEPLRAALQASGELPTPPHCRVDVLTLQKKLP